MITIEKLLPDAPLRIIIGAAGKTYHGWIPTEQEELNLLRRRDWELRFGARRIDNILAEHVWEHLTYEEGIEAASICFDFLKPGGLLRCAVPDKNFQNEWYQQMVQVGGPGPEDHPAASHKIVYDYITFSDVFSAAGFQVRLLEYFDEAGQFHYTDWDPAQGMIGRSSRYDTRNADGTLRMVSLIIDAIKPW